MTGGRTKEAREEGTVFLSPFCEGFSLDLIVGIPNKGRLLKGCEDLLDRANYKYRRSQRQMVTRVEEIRGRAFSLVLMRQEDILKRLIKGDIDLGIVGSDRLFEAYPNFSDRFVSDRPEGLKAEPLSFGLCKLVLAVPEDYPVRRGVDPVNTLAAKRIGTSYPRTVERFFLDRVILGVKIEEAEGAVESMVGLGWVDGIADLVETGRSLRENRLKPLCTIADVKAMLVMNFNGLDRIRYSNQFYKVIDALRQADKQNRDEVAICSGSDRDESRRLNSGSYWNY